MNPRYSAPLAERIFSDASRAQRMRKICDQYTDDALRGTFLGLGDPEWTKETITSLLSAPGVLVHDWKKWEEIYGHEIVGFLAAYLERLDEEVHPYVHYGLTSSDLVENEMHQAFAEHAESLEPGIGALMSTLGVWVEVGQNWPRAGRTHGQTAELTSLGHQFKVFWSMFDRIWLDIEAAAVPYAKTPGPTGNSKVRSPIKGWWAVPSTQVIPRDILLRWASAYLNLANALETLAMFVRLGSRSEIGEFTEGAASRRQGSSAMPGKVNPIQSEKVCGLARVARGLHASIAQVSALWEERDLSNSSTERLSVPDLAAVVEHMLDTMVSVLQELNVDGDRVMANTQNPRCFTSELQMRIQRTDRVGPIEASRLANERGIK